MKKLSPQEISGRLQELTGWSLNDGKLVKQYVFKDFREAVEFISKIRPKADAANHHPDLCINYNKVTVELTTHDAGGLTQLDFDMAKLLDEAYYKGQ